MNGPLDSDWQAFVALSTIDTTHDVMGRKLRETHSGDGGIISLKQYSYDGAGRLECEVTRMDPAQWAGQVNACVPQTTGPFGADRVTRYSYNAAGQLHKKHVAVGTSDVAVERTHTYTANTRLQTIMDGENNLTTYEYDGFDRLYRTRYPSATQGAGTSSSTDFEQLSYDENGNVVQRRLRDGQLIGLAYDGLNRSTSKDLPAGEADVGYAYDLQGRLLSATQGMAGVTRTYDALGRELTESTGHGTMSYQYDAAGRRTRTTWPDGFFVTQEFLTTGEVHLIREQGVSALVTFSYDNLRRRTSMSGSNGTATSFQHDAASRLTSLSHDLNDPASDVTSAFTYTPASQLRTWTRNNDAYAWTSHYNVNRSYVADGLNRVTQSDSGSTPLTFGYDARGNLTNYGPAVYGYTAENRLGTASSGATFHYDPLGRLSQSSGMGTTSRFQYDGHALVTEWNSSGQIVRRYVHGPGVDEPLVWYEGNSASSRRWFHRDERGSVVAISDSAGQRVAINSYDEFGTPAGGNLGRFQYTGQVWLPELGLYHYKARMYAPALGRFMQTDPIGYDDDVNLYAYVGNDPLNKSDPTGEFGIVGFIIGAGLEIGMQTLVQGKSFSEVDYGDVLVAGAVSAVIPGLANAAKVGYNSTKVVSQSVKAISRLSEQSAKTANKAQKLDQRIGRNLDKIQGAVAEAGKAAAVAGLHQAVKAAGQEAVPPMTASSSRESNTSGAPNVSNTPATGAPEPGPLPRQPLPCGSPNTTGCGR